jgi:hypothetical protein
MKTMCIHFVVLKPKYVLSSDWKFSVRAEVMVCNKQVKTMKNWYFFPYTHLSQGSKSYLFLQERTLEDGEMSTPRPLVLVTGAFSERKTLQRS